MKQREIADGIMWRSLAHQDRRGFLLSPAGLREAGGFFARMREAPERARRYLGDQQMLAPVRSSAEWRAVEAVLRRSFRLQAAVGVFAILLLVVTTAAGVTVTVLLKQRAGVLTLQRRSLEETKLLTTILQKEVAARDRVVDAALNITTTDADQTGKNASRATELVTSASAIGALEEIAEKVSDGRGYIWVANGSPQILADASGRTVTPDRIMAGDAYDVLNDIAVRSGPPSPPNRFAPRIGVARTGTKVLALAVAQIWRPSGQFWLHQQPLPTVWIQIAPDAQAAGARLKAQLDAEGFAVPPVQPLPQAAGLRQIRYCYRADADAAVAVAAKLNRMGYRGVAARAIAAASCGRAKPGSLELWLGSPTETRAAAGGASH